MPQRDQGRCRQVFAMAQRFLQSGSVIGPVTFRGTQVIIKERRRFPRHRVMGVGKISVSETEPSMDCIVIDWSEGGARLRLVEPEKCPDAFTLFTKDGKTTECRVVWRQEANVGVEFLEPSPPSAR
jgi:PilZ domain